MEISLIQQSTTLLISVCVGIALCLLYDVFRIFRMALRFSAIAIFFQDILFAIISALITFLLLMVFCEGEVRGFVLVSELVGFIICRFTVSKAITKVSSAIIQAFRKIARLINRTIIKPSNRFFDIIGNKIDSILFKTKEKVKKSKFLKKNA